MYKKNHLTLAQIISIPMKLFIWIVIIPILLTLNGKPANAAGALYVSPAGNDSNDCLSPATACATINVAIAKATEGDTIYVSTGTFTGSSGEVVLVNKYISLSGGWNADFTSQTGFSTIDGESVRRGVTVGFSSTSIDHFIIQNGSAEFGGGISSQGILAISNSQVKNNNAGWMGGGLYLFGGTATINSTSITNNNAGLDCCGGGGGGIQVYGAVVTMTNSSVIGNQLMYNSEGSGICNFGNLVIENSTISGNSGGDSTGIYSFSGPVQLYSVTITNNGKGVFNQASEILISNSIITDNYYDIQNDSSYPTSIINNKGYNLYKSYLGFTPDPTDLAGKQPAFGPLSGTPAYLPLLKYSLGIDAGNPTGCMDHLGDPLNSDQRGHSRVGRCDIGAFEFDPGTDPFSYTFLPCSVTPCIQYFDDFSNPASGWPVDDTKNVLYEYLNNEYRLLVHPKHYGGAARPGYQASDYVASVDLYNSNGAAGSYGILFGLAQDWSTTYSLEIYPNGWYGIYMYNATSMSTLKEAYSPVINQGKAKNRISVERNGGSIIAYANGQILDNVTDINFTGNLYLGLVVFSFDQTNVDIRFDNFSVHPVTCLWELPTTYKSFRLATIPFKSFSLLKTIERYPGGNSR